ncbi:hypothetical protein RSOLAG22IIIB_05763 [Rhizoctonia solani]|uniref:Uncharacterized protein n=1 Tax=Rhizoctonia solani TaxID=456999 RepID=A0A0K6G999_9AGAM|nr:hypothetical protein RSOLAG22IIIB_05763 [Rhizoctonia solani]
MRLHLGVANLMALNPGVPSTAERSVYSVCTSTRLIPYSLASMRRTWSQLEHTGHVHAAERSASNGNSDGATSKGCAQGTQISTGRSRAYSQLG